MFSVAENPEITIRANRALLTRVSKRDSRGLSYCVIPLSRRSPLRCVIYVKNSASFFVSYDPTSMTSPIPFK